MELDNVVTEEVPELNVQSDAEAETPESDGLDVAEKGEGASPDEAKAYRDVFPTANDAVKVRDLVEGIGGQEGLQKIQGDLEAWAEHERAYAEDSPAFVRQLAESNPDAFQKMVPEALNRWAESSPEAYRYFSTSVALNTMAQIGLSPKNLESLYAQMGHSREAQQIVGTLYQLVNGLQSKAQQFVQSERDPAKLKFQKEKQDFEQTRQSVFDKDLNAARDSYTLEQAKPVMEKLLGSRNVPQGIRDIMGEKLTPEIAQRLFEVPGLDARLYALEQAKNSDGVMKLYQESLPKVLEAATGAVVEKYAGKGNAQRSQAEQGHSRSTTTVRLKDAPPTGKVDWKKTSREEYIVGRGFLADGRRFQVVQ